MFPAMKEREKCGKALITSEVRDTFSHLKNIVGLVLLKYNNLSIR